MKRRILFWLTALILVAMLSGCGNSIKSEQDLIEDLNSTSQIYMVEGSQVTELSIIKRLTDEDNHSDKVYVSILIDHPNATETRAYIMNYTLYNDGWMLDDVEDYYGDEAIWQVSPKGAPTNEQVMAELIAYSNAQINAAYAQQHINEELTHTYFFEEGKYSTKIYTGSFTSKLEYSCIVETERVFNYVEVYEEQLLHFYFDNYLYEWKLYSDKIIRLYSEWYLDGQWHVPSNDATIQFSWIGGHYGDTHKERYDEFAGLCTCNGETLDFYVTVPIPSSQIIDAGCTLFGEVIWGPVCLELQISPNSIHCFDFFGEIHSSLYPISPNGYPSALDITGIIDMSTHDRFSTYYETSQKILNAIFIEADFSYLDQLWHPTIKQNVKDKLKYDIESEDVQILSISHLCTEMFTKDQPDPYGIREELEEIIGSDYEHTTIVACQFYAEKLYKDTTDFDKIWVIFAIEGDQIYLLNVI